MLFLFKLILAVVLALVVLILLGMARTWQMEHSADEVAFRAGAAPNPPPDGFYNGNVPGEKVSWLGKKFDAATNTGINIFAGENGSSTEKYPFTTSYQTNTQEKNRSVLAIDYNLPANPFWLRPILDEVVQIAPKKLLGKMQLRLIPGYPFTILYFTLEQ